MLKGLEEDHTLSLGVLCGQVQGKPGRGTLVAVSRAGGFMEGWSGILSWEKGNLGAGKGEMEKETDAQRRKRQTELRKGGSRKKEEDGVQGRKRVREKRGDRDRETATEGEM